jgi:F0F1-type ATP synthase membrane subunit b/b'
MKDEILTQSKAESERIIAQARAQAEQERERMEKNIRVMSVELSQKILSGVIQSLFTPEEKQRILKKAVQEIEKNNEALQ